MENVNVLRALWRVVSGKVIEERGIPDLKDIKDADPGLVKKLMEEQTCAEKRAEKGFKDELFDQAQRRNKDARTRNDRSVHRDNTREKEQKQMTIDE